MIWDDQLVDRSKKGLGLKLEETQSRAASEAGNLDTSTLCLCGDGGV